LMAALCYNLKKYMKFSSRTSKTNVQALAKPMRDSRFWPDEAICPGGRSPNTRLKFLEALIYHKNSPLHWGCMVVYEGCY